MKNELSPPIYNVIRQQFDSKDQINSEMVFHRFSDDSPVVITNPRVAHPFICPTTAKAVRDFCAKQVPELMDGIKCRWIVRERCRTENGFVWTDLEE